MSYDAEAAFNHHDQFTPGRKSGTKRPAPAPPAQTPEPVLPLVEDPPTAVTEPPESVVATGNVSIPTVADTPVASPEPTPSVPDEHPASSTVPESQELSPAPADGSFPQPDSSGDSDSGN